ncbi:MerR family transcriptional regulator [Micromonospora sp. NBRC 101691]|uniref:MerR family transcriptional regulator n=1 Tax=Micromonospora sp. NBRC 101691 TaxID=3032198 RepID=UPI0024A5C1F6|nr:MerR family transcriptional regulator [Micromonospora sp. NBRC 101691]GLY24200.1 MerR family transcriptional regulator [Micromonospora sp. NBRC 101691]
MRISRLVELSGVPATTLRFYETVGLLSPQRSNTGYRLYGEETVQRLAFIGAAKGLGLPLDEIAELLGVWQSGACREVKADLRPRIAVRLGDAERRTAELAAFIATLHRALEHLDALPDRDSRCDPGCAFLASDRIVPAPLAAPGPVAAGAGAERWRAVPVACSLTGEDGADRTEQWHGLLAGADRETIDGGVRLALPAERTGAVAALAAAEQQCCPFFDFRLHLDGPVLRLEVRAPADGAGLLAGLFGPVAA